jgi:TonB family protein
MRLWVGLVVLLLASCAARSQQTMVAGKQARVGSVILHLEPASVVRPALPEAARGQGIFGPVLVEVRIAETGDVSVLSVVRGHPLLNDLAKTAVGQWKYPPTVFEGRVIPVIAIVAVSFVQGSGEKEPS